MIHALWVPVAFKLAPIFVGRMALNTFVNKVPGHPMRVPMPVLEAVAQHAFDVVHKAAKVESGLSGNKMPGTLEMIVSYTHQLEYYAGGIRQIVKGDLDMETARIRFPVVAAIIDASIK